MAYKKFYTRQLILTVLLTLYVCCLLNAPAKAEIRSRGANSVHTSNNKNKNEGQLFKKSTDDNDDDDVVATSSASSSETSSTSSHINTDFMDKLSWKCANNGSCLYSLASGILSSYRRGDTVKFGFLDLVKLPTSTHKTKSKFNSAETGRSMSTFVDFISGNAIRIPVGPMVFSVQRAEDDDNYIEVALLKKARSSTARLGGNGGDGGGGGLLGGGGLGGGDSGGGHHLMHRIRGQKDKDDKKQMQMFIPMYLAATTFGWTMVAAKAVGLLTIKALAISKIAFVVAAMVFMKKLMENASEKMMYQYPEQSPYMMPYSMDYGMHSMAAAPPDMAAAADMYGAGLPMHAAVSPMQAHQGHPSYEHLTAESMVHQSIADIQNNTQVMAALNAAGLGQNKVKREDSWLARKPFLHFAPTARFPHKSLSSFLTKHKLNLKEFKSYDDFITVAAVAAAEVVVDENEKRLKFKSDFFGEDDDDDEEEEDDVFNEEENIKDTLKFLAANAARRPMVYNYLNPHTAYYRQ